MPSPVFQNVIGVAVHLSQRRNSGLLMNVAMKNIILLLTKLSGVAKLAV
jgi:hypothetical protein